MKMRALEFITEIKNDQICIPDKIRGKLRSDLKQKVRVILLFEDINNDDNLIMQESASDYFLKGYAESDSIYDNF
jgi:hypothetical protein